MSFAAILSASKLSADAGGVLRANLHFAGQSLVEYQARQASRAGASAILILVSAVTPQLSQAIDRLSADGIAVTLIRDMVTLVRDAPRDRDMLLVADGAVVGQAYYDAIGQLNAGQSGGNVLLVADDSRASAPFERIDAGQRWAGLARVTPDLLFGTIDMIGDWDLELTLVRAAVQAGARRITIPQEDLMEGRVALVEGQPQADLVARAAISGPGGDGEVLEGGVEHYALSRMATMLAPLLMRSQVPAMQTRIAGIALATVGLVPIQLGWRATGLLLLLVSLTLHLAADRLEEMALRVRPVGIIAFAVPALVLIGIGLVDGGFSALYLILLLGIVAVAIRWGRTGQVRPWMLFTPGSAALLLLVAGLLGSLLEGLMLAMLAAIVSLGAIVLHRPAP
ncbi:hypothetical protein [Sphingobium aromaticiconvertens]|uniref:hypothetical protein n=1 Tax=Sphingobium aromaticiconvertens TaxID=365341 RepID=UPI00301A2439